MRASIAAYAKINLTLDVVGKLSNGYHELLMVMQSVSLHDMLAIETGTGDGITLRSNLTSLPCDESNLVHKAICAFYDAAKIPQDGIAVAIEKRIPLMAGLAGGSSDAAAVIRALNLLYNTRFTDAELIKIGLRVGADVPFCIFGGTMLARGVGEQLSPLSALPDCTILLVKPEFSMSTPYVFSALDQLELTRRPDTEAMTHALAQGMLPGIAENLCNVMEQVTAVEHPEISEIKRRMLEFGALGSAMSGSGPTVFGLFAVSKAAHRAYAAFLREYAAVYLCHPCSANADADILLPHSGKKPF